MKNKRCTWLGSPCGGGASEGWPWTTAPTPAPGSDMSNLSERSAAPLSSIAAEVLQQNRRYWRGSQVLGLSPRGVGLVSVDFNAGKHPARGCEMARRGMCGSKAD